MKQIAEWDLNQGELMVAANCHLKDFYPNIDCDHCIPGHYCQDIGKAYQKKLLECLKTQVGNHPIPAIEKFICGISLQDIKLMLKKLEEANGK